MDASPLPPASILMCDTALYMANQFLAASWLNVALYTAELMLCYKYFRRPSRPFVHRLGVATLALADGICTVDINVAAVFNITGTVSNSPYAFAVPIALQIMTTYISSAVAQLFFANLFYILTSNLIISCSMVLLIIVHVAFSWTSAFILLAEPRSNSTANFAYTATAIGAVSCAATDILISACLALQFWQLMPETVPGRTTRSLVRRVTILVVASGAVCATVTLTMMILYLNDSFAFNFLFALQGRIYALSILGNFLVGVPGRSPRGTSQSHPFGSSLSQSVVFHVPDTAAHSPRQQERRETYRLSQPKSIRHNSLLASAFVDAENQEDDDLEGITFAFPSPVGKGKAGPSRSFGSVKDPDS
ncbi:hypothetical protein R3P38DRAFT_3259165 [Favolaschia claudopus]|uniref:DUF6534 domain-containing protein n=1 Tax=Favolaschia claudopus TaxID=2862362 RepID=A0AAW0D3J1_9AGAR